jgi:hypothetical protein
VASDDLSRWLAYAHPAWMLVSFGLAFMTLRLGLRMRRLRATGGKGRGALMKRHMRLGKPAVALLCIGFVGGPVSALLLRNWTPFSSLHAWLGLLAAVLFATAAWLGNTLAGRQGEARSKAVEAHARFGLGATLVGGLACFAGFVLLP